MFRKWLLVTSLFASITSVSASSQAEIEDANNILPRTNLINFDNLPIDILLKIDQYLDDKSLTSLTSVSHDLAYYAETVFKDRSWIKRPLNYLIHDPYSYKMSYLIRKHLYKIFTNSYDEKDMVFYDKLTKSEESFNNWKYVGKVLFEAYRGSDFKDICILYQRIKNDNLDLKEIQFLIQISVFSYRTLNTNDKKYYLDAILSKASRMPDLEKKEIASPYLFLLADSSSQVFNSESLIKLYEFCADQGHQEAQFTLGNIFYDQKDIFKLSYYYKCASDQGHIKSNINLGIICKKIGKTKKAEEYFKFAANRGHEVAQINLAILYNELEDKNNAIKYFKLAANQGHKVAQANLAILYLQQGKEIEAEKYFKLAMDPEYQTALKKIAEDCTTKGDLVKAIEFYELASDHGQRSFQITLGDAHKKLGNMNEAMKSYQLAADQGYIKIQDIIKK